MERLKRILSHLRHPENEEDDLFPFASSSWSTSECIGEMENRQVDAEDSKASSSAYTRVTLKIAFVDKSQADERYGGSGDIAILEGELLLPKNPSKTVFIFMHP